jgi:aspartyl-tRNA(Asn)/glutamyl-tRNA(Gln) amidotransferase subunit B
VTTRYETVIGLEVHAQLLTASKMFCGCSADYAAAPPNTHVCPVCMALPGVLPVINRAAVEKTILTGLALNCTIAPEAVFARKNYHYPDLPKGYQISQYELPLCRNGWLEIVTEAGARRVGITRAHLEEDTGKLTHARDHSLVDLNRAGVPLLEIVTEPDMRSPEEARAYLIKLQTILRYLGVSTADMEKGAMRCEANVSVRSAGQRKFGTKVEIKNLNSFRSVKLAVEYEVARQIALLEAGERVAQVTMGWDEERGRTFVQRSKETAHDYRYFPEPDLPPLTPERAWIEDIARELPELPDAKAARFVHELGLDPRDAALLAGDRAVADYFEAVVRRRTALASSRDRVSARTVANWITGELFRLMNASDVAIEALRISPDALAELLAMVEAGQINPNTGKRVLEVMFEAGRRAPEIVQELGLAQVSDADSLAVVVADVVARYPDEVAKYRAGGDKVLAWFMGQVMRETRGKGNPAVVRELLERALRGDERADSGRSSAAGAPARDNAQ